MSLSLTRNNGHKSPIANMKLAAFANNVSNPAETNRAPTTATRKPHVSAKSYDNSHVDPMYPAGNITCG